MSTSAVPSPPNSTPELLYLLHGDPADLADALSGMRAADIAEALRELKPDAAAKVLAALPFDLAVQVFDEPELVHDRCAIIQHMDERSIGPLVDAMSADQQADLFRELPDKDRSRLLKQLDAPTQHALRLLLRYPPDTAGGIMTTEFVSMPTTWTVERALRHIGEVGGAKETVYAIYVLAPDTQQLVHVVSLRELLLADRNQTGRTVSETAHADHGHAADRSRGSRAPHLQVQPAGRSRRRRRRSRPRHRHGGRRDRRDRSRADGGRAEVRRRGGARSAVHGDRLLGDDQEARWVAHRALPRRRCSRRRRWGISSPRSRRRSCWRSSFR